MAPIQTQRSFTNMLLTGVFAFNALVTAASEVLHRGRRGTEVWAMGEKR
jgi:hypothetical protein